MKVATKVTHEVTWKRSPKRLRKSAGRRACQADVPLVKGGQGRSGTQLSESACAVLACVLAAAVVLALATVFE